MIKRTIRGLPGYRVRRVDETADNLVIDAALEAEVLRCFHCNSDQLVGFGWRQRTIVDRPTRGRRVQIHVSVRRLKCKSCTRLFGTPLPGVDGRRFMTDRLIKWVVEQAARRTFVSIAAEIGVAESTIRAVCREFPELAQRTRMDHPN